MISHQTYRQTKRHTDKRTQPKIFPFPLTLEVKIMTNDKSQPEVVYNVWPGSQQNPLTFPDHSQGIKNKSLIFHKS